MAIVIVIASAVVFDDSFGLGWNNAQKQHLDFKFSR